MDDMDKRLDGHTWCRTITSNIHNNQGLTFRKSLCVGQLVCINKSCDFFTRSSMRNETEWSGRTNTPFKLGHLSLSDSTLVCKVAPICVNFCPGRIYYVLGSDRMWLACEPGAGSGERGAGIKRAGSRDCRKKSRNR
jgi:hypothetical protein